ncbi:hypothetical protein ACH5RR_032275 [Cinchona calisaya]|uniref:Uncharacterized protein n=1 Tax=Cinchona calisaya TaxID=153742 RepID=A0ABD2YHN9_9GENT
MAEKLDECLKKFTLSADELARIDLDGIKIQTMVEVYQRSLIGKMVVPVWNSPIHWYSRELGFKIRRVFKGVKEVVLYEIGAKEGKHPKILVDVDVSKLLLRETLVKLAGYFEKSHGNINPTNSIVKASQFRSWLKAQSGKSLSSERRTSATKDSLRANSQMAWRSTVKGSNPPQVEVHQGKEFDTITTSRLDMVGQANTTNCQRNEEGIGHNSSPMQTNHIHKGEVVATIPTDMGLELSSISVNKEKETNEVIVVARYSMVQQAKMEKKESI